MRVTAGASQLRSRFANRQTAGRGVRLALPALEEHSGSPWASLLTWIYHGSNNSLHLVMLLHAAVNTWSGPLRISPEAAGSLRPFALVVVLTWVLALLVVAGPSGFEQSRFVFSKGK